MKKVVILLLVLALTASSTISFLPVKANPYMYHEIVSAPAYVKPPNIAISSPKENAFYSINGTVTLSFNVTGPDASNLLTKYLSTVDYKGDWMQNAEHSYRTKNFEEYTPDDFPFFLEFNFKITRIPEGKHSIIINSTGGGGYADMNTLTWYNFDIVGYKVVNFTIDNTPPKITLVHPQNETYEKSDVPLEVTTNERVSLVTFSIDGQDNVTVAENTTLGGLSEGTHNVTVYATDAAGNVGASETLTFFVFVPQPFPTASVAAVSVGSAIMVATGLLVYFKKRR